MSGLSRTPGKRVWANTHRGFESRPLRQASTGPSGPVLLSPPQVANRSDAIRPRKNAIRRAMLVCSHDLLNTAVSALLSVRREVEMSQKLKGWMGLCLTLGLVTGGLPAEASEVVKLARLVVSGKRSPSDPPRSAPAEPRPANSNPQAHGNGGSDQVGTAPAPARGVS